MTCLRCERPAKVKGYCKAHYNARRTKWVRAGLWQRHSPVSVIGVTRRLRALVALGYSQNELCRRSGISPSTLSHLIRGSVDRTSVETARRVTALYDALSMRPGPSDYHRNYARRLGWVPPLAWDDDLIDNPQAKPDLGEKRTIRWDERYLELREIGLTDVEILHRWGIQPQSLLRQLERYGIPQSAELQAMMRDRMCGVAS